MPHDDRHRHRRKALPNSLPGFVWKWIYLLTLGWTMQPGYLPKIYLSKMPLLLELMASFQARHKSPPVMQLHKGVLPDGSNVAAQRVPSWCEVWHAQDYLLHWEWFNWSYSVIYSFLCLHQAIFIHMKWRIWYDMILLCFAYLIPAKFN